jgi:pilus assembly protein Flp/PilA
MLGLYLNARNFATSRLAREEKGATAVEYGIMVALIAVAIIGAVTIFGSSLTTMFTEASCTLKGGTLAAAVDGVRACSK